MPAFKGPNSRKKRKYKGLRGESGMKDGIIYKRNQNGRMQRTQGGQGSNSEATGSSGREDTVAQTSGPRLYLTGIPYTRFRRVLFLLPLQLHLKP